MSLNNAGISAWRAACRFSFAALVASLVSLGVSADAQVLHGVAAGKTLHRLDLGSGASTLVGSLPTVSAFEHSLTSVARRQDGVLFGISTAQSGGVGSSAPSFVYQIDEASAQTVAALSVGLVTTVGAAFDPTDGSLHYLTISAPPFGPNGPDITLFRVDVALQSSTLIGLLPSGGQLRHLLFDDAGQLYVLNITTNTLWRVDKANPSSAQTVPVGTGLGSGIDLGDGGAFTRDAGTGITWGFEGGNVALFTIDLATGVGTPAFPLGPTPDYFSLAASACAFPALKYGAGCMGAGGFIPELSMSPCPIAGDQVTLQLGSGFGGASALFFLGLNQTSLPIGGGCSLLVTPAIPLFSAPLGGSGNGGGSVSIPIAIPLQALGVTVNLQAFVSDASNPIGAAASNGLQVTIQ